MTDDIGELRHGTFVQVATFGVLITGAPGAGKSSLALQLIDAPGTGLGTELMTAQLVADDQVYLWRETTTSTLYGKAPTSISGLLEIRGVGIVSIAHVTQCQLHLVVRLSENEDAERLPEHPQNQVEILGQSIPVVDIFAGDGAAIARIRAAVNTVSGNYLIDI